MFNCVTLAPGYVPYVSFDPRPRSGLWEAQRCDAAFMLVLSTRPATDFKSREQRDDWMVWKSHSSFIMHPTNTTKYVDKLYSLSPHTVEVFWNGMLTLFKKKRWQDEGKTFSIYFSV